MTVFVATLFLPETIHFNLPTPQYDHPKVNDNRKNKRDIATQQSLFTPIYDQTPPNSPDQETSHENNSFFAHASNNIKSQCHKPQVHRSAPSEPHSRTWGARTFLNQPLSRASSPPPANILKHYEPIQNSEFIEKTGTSQSSIGQDNNHDQIFAHAQWTVVPADQGNGGLRNAVHAAIRGGKISDKMWVGTLGMPTDALEGTQQKQEIEDKLAMEYDSITIFCKDSDFSGHYTHYSKQILWPVFHYQIPDHPKSKAYEDHSWVYYVKVNQAFADQIVKNWKRGDVIWVHDYHLLLVPQMIRKQLPDVKIGFFLHIAFPSSEVFRCLAVRKELLEGMLGANLIGFQIKEYARHFLQTCSRLLSVEATNKGVQLEDRYVDVIDLAIGIDPIALNLNRTDPDVREWIQIMQERYRGKKLIVARDKLDHIRGVRPKLLAYELFLNKYPEWRDKVVLIQVATSTTEQTELDATVSDIVTRVNSSWANLAYQPLFYLKQDINFAQYLALLSVADVLMISSQREGMNLTCHEFVFCQDGKVEGQKKNGCLILSEFTGSTSAFGRNELSVNPWDFRQCAEAIRTALVMDEDEKKRRWSNLYKAVMHHTAENWYITFLTTLDRVFDEQNLRQATSIPRLSINQLGQEYQKSKKRCFILDYDGTLTSWGSPKDTILTSPQRTIDVLNDVLQDERNIVYVMSGRKPEELDQLFKHNPNIGLIAENGCYIKMFCSSTWIEEADPEEIREWKESVQGTIQYFSERMPGSWIESRRCRLIFHYETCEDQESACRLASDCVSHVNDACDDQNVRAVPIEGAVVVEPIYWSKVTAAETVFNDIKSRTQQQGDQNVPVDLLIVIGNNRDDEGVFRWANVLHRQKIVENVTTVSLGSRNTEAGYTLNQGVTGVLTVLKKLSMIS
ncbi:putative alpha,alpha-trehalose-phosphate synthase 106 kDa subunit [Golovinomyces cichoracearum]|uniref:Putative alpha,alpha-trehalose-phosphate synthase 106 kDa subunit n=1 Tax=Golovinomyces cichoracearum TaxID=62708 RepID=A0A420IGH5_9PEZI|nr:putative alpha,alpha-trehalose-phosphate synthase 106 kDa subunit [Golovinomyces cichoracearum]